MVTPSACDTVEAWLRANAQRIGMTELRFERAASIGKLSAGYEVPGHRVSVTAWDNASCLDIDLLELRSGAVRMLCAGATSGEADILARLDALESWTRDRSGI